MNVALAKKYLLLRTKATKLNNNRQQFHPMKRLFLDTHGKDRTFT